MRLAIASFTLGVFLLQQQGTLWSPVSLIMTLAGIAGLSLLCTHLRQPIWRCLMVCLLGLLSGWLWASVFALVRLAQPLDLQLEEQPLTVIGIIDSLPAATEFGTRLQFSPEQVLTPGVNLTQLPQTVLLSWNGNSTSVQPGERWRLTLRLRRPHGLANWHGFDYEVWLLGQGIGATGIVITNDLSLSNLRLNTFVFSLHHWIERMRGKLRDHIQSALPQQPYVAILVALVTGEQNAIDTQDWTLFARTGVSHLIAISGMHITLLAGLFAKIMSLLWRHPWLFSARLPLMLPAQKAAALAGMFAALCYVALAGFGVPAQRTLIMLSVVAFAACCNRHTSSSQVLSLALLAVLLFDPWAVLWPGFWLSFVAVSVIFFAAGSQHAEVDEPDADTPRISRVIVMLRQAWSTQYAVTVGLLPLTILLFNQISLISPLANALAIPVISYVVAPGALIGSVMPAPLNVWILTLTQQILHWLISCLTWLSSLSWAVWQAAYPPWWLMLIATIGTVWCLAPTGWPFRWAGLLAWIPLLLNTSHYPVGDEFVVTALDIGQGTAVLIETAHHRMLYDTGPTYSSQADAGSRVIGPYLKARGIHRLDGLMISHNDTDHSGGALSLMQQVSLGWVKSSLSGDSPVVQQARKQSRHIPCLAGDAWQWDGVQFELLHPDEEIYSQPKASPNSKSCTLKISRGRQAILLPGDIEARQERALITSIPDKLAATVLFAPHHGSATSSTEEFLQAVHPDWAIFQFGYHNRYHHPNDVVWRRYATQGIRRLRNDDAGAISIYVGNEIRVETYRANHPRYWYPVAE